MAGEHRDENPWTICSRRWIGRSESVAAEVEEEGLDCDLLRIRWLGEVAVAGELA